MENTKNELEGFKVMANAILNLNNAQIDALITNNSLIEVL